MSAIPPIHLAIIQPLGYVHSLGFLDQARYFRQQLRRLGAQVTLAKNRLREDAVNIVFGAHLGFPGEWRQRHACLFVNLEQLGAGGAQLPPSYLKLLQTSAVIDYDAANVSAYAAHPEDVPLIEFGYAAYLDDHQGPPLADRPIDLLFIGSMNPRRQALLARIEACGHAVTHFDHAVYGPERDHFIQQAKAVFNCHFYEAARFEQARAFQCLSLGTPVISERRATSRAPAAFEDSVIWLQDTDIEHYFTNNFKQAAFYEDARRTLSAFRQGDDAHDPLEPYAEVLAFAQGFAQGHARNQPQGPWLPTQLNVGSGKAYRPGWLNVDILERAQPDLVLDLGQAQTWPLQATTPGGTPVLLNEASLDTIDANNVLEHIPDLPTFMTNALALLKVGGDMVIEVPYERALTAWQDPTHLRAMNENSWVYYTDWFWYLGWFEHRFDQLELQWLNLQLQPCPQDQAAFMRTRLRKVRTSVAERMAARTMQADFGGLPSDDMPQLTLSPPALTATQAQAVV